ncbi:family 1 glycosylhydrolase [Streptomyces fuscichromogenes]|uniref:Beta-glucosidase n=1 Tax=Streptomyces fuscichromogenes TaxID=1324013 RepID=A0A917X9W0_9ACTN|nr:family 1 glycosylhydrolase [Streptomyces fuscichromogenes]GGM98590.1 beta-glucosidase [Streptomyces fuscichromogenes]
MSHNPDAFLWGASTSPHQVEGNNVNSDWWVREQNVARVERSGDALDSYHRYEEDMRLLAGAGLNAYRFGVEWARIEPAPGHFSTAELAHYRGMIDTALEYGLTPVVTLHHFTHPRWFAEEGGWLGSQGVSRYLAYVRRVTGILQDVPWVCTINEPNMLAHMVHMSRAVQSGEWPTPTVEGEHGVPALPDPDPEVGRLLGEAHQAARAILKGNTDAAVGWTVSCQALTATPGNEAKLREVRYVREDLYLEYAREDDFIGVQAYSSQAVDANGVVPHPQGPDTTLTGNAYRPDALGIAVRHAWETTGGVPVLVTENGIATADDNRRIAYTDTALQHLFAAIDDGIDVRGYLHWSALDNFEWGHWRPTFGLIAVDRETFVRLPKASLYWLGETARRGRP